MLREFMLRRIGGLENNAGLAVLVDGLGKSTDADEQLNIVAGMRTALAGQRQAKPPAGWAAVYGKLAQERATRI